MNNLKMAKLKNKTKNGVKYACFSLFCLSSLLLIAFSLICFVYAIINVATNFNLQNATIGKEKVLSILLIVLIFSFVFILLAIGVYYLVKFVLWQAKNIEKDEIYYYFFGKKWVVSVVSLLLGFTTLFGFSFLFGYYIPWFNTIFTTLLSIAYFVNCLVNTLFYIYSIVWYKKQPKKYQDRYLEIVNELDNHSLTKKELKKSSKVKVQNIAKSNVETNNQEQVSSQQENTTESVENTDEQQVKQENKEDKQ